MNYNTCGLRKVYIFGAFA